MPRSAPLSSAAGTAGRGTINNCANGYMPWGTYMTNEENWAGYFRRDTGDVAARGGATAKANVSLARYGIPENRAGNFGWATGRSRRQQQHRLSPLEHHRRSERGGRWFGRLPQRGQPVRLGGRDRSLHRHLHPAQAHRARPHETTKAAGPARTVAGIKPAFYMGDDAQNEYIYKFVSATPWVATDASPADRLATGDKYLNSGTLYVAQVRRRRHRPVAAARLRHRAADRRQRRLSLRRPGRRAAERPPRRRRARRDQDGPARMDRDQSGLGRDVLHAHQTTPRAPSPTPTPPIRAAYTDPKVTTGSTSGNANGHVIRLRETGDTTEATRFAWGHLRVRIGLGSQRRQHQSVGPRCHQRFLLARRPVVRPFEQPDRPGDAGLVDRDRRQRLYRRHQLHAARGHSGRGRRRRHQDDHQHDRRRYGHADHDRRQGPPAPSSAASWSAARNARSPASTPPPTAARCSSTSSTPARTATRPTSPATGRPSQTGAAVGSRPRSATIVITKDDGGRRRAVR